MIIRNFFRRTTTRIYIVLLSIIIATVSVLNSLNVFLDNQANKIYINSMRLIVSTEQNLYDVLKANENIMNIKRGFLLESPENSIQFVDEDPNLDKPLQWASFSYLSLTSVTTYLGDNDLVENEIELGFSSLDYYNSTVFLNDYLGKTITADYKGEKLKLVIKRVYDAGPFPEIKISKDIYNKLERKATTYFYSSQIKHERFEEDIKSELLKYKKEEEDKIVVPHIYSQSTEVANYDALEKMNSQIKLLKNITYVLSIIFLIMFIIISKNILEDLETTIRLENMLGFSKKNIQFNLIKRILSMYILTIILSNILSIIIVFVLNNKYSLGMQLLNFKFLIIILIVILSCNLLLVGTINNKLNIKKHK